MSLQSFNGAQYLVRGLNLITQPGIRVYVITPLMINFLLLSLALSYLINQSDNFMLWITGAFPWIMGWFGWLIKPLFIIVMTILVFYLFAILANWIAAPFNALLAEAVETHLSGRRPPDSSWSEIAKDIPRLLGREWQKLKYYLPKAIGCLLLFLIFPPIAAVVWFLFNAWMMAIQYIDYPMDNHKIPFQQMLELLRKKRTGPWGFGATVMLITLIPFVNLLVIPVAVAGATALWCEQYHSVTDTRY